MKSIKVVFLTIFLLHIFVATYPQYSIGLKSGIGVYNQIPYLFRKENPQQNNGTENNPKFKSKAISGIGYFSSISHQFNTGYTIHLGYDNGMLEQSYNDPLGIYWDNTYRINYQVHYISFSKQFRKKKFYTSPEIGIVLRQLAEDKIDYEFQITSGNTIHLELPGMLNRKLTDLGVKVAIDNGWKINNMISIGIRISSDFIGLIPETLMLSPYFSIEM